MASKYFVKEKNRKILISFDFSSSSFGSKIRSISTGIILNNQMDDFSTVGKNNNFQFRPSKANFISPGKRPLSSMCPIIVLDSNGDAVFVTGAKGGSKIITSVASVSLFSSNLPS